MDRSSNQESSDELYGTAAIRENQLERWPNPYPGRPYVVSFDIPEFTCLCPRSGFPDFALVKVRYQPRGWIVELKSLKLYINGYRDLPISHEAAANRILDDLVTLLDPRWMRVTADFTVRGNIKTVVRAEHGVRELPSVQEPRDVGTGVSDAAPARTHCLLLSGGLDSATLAAWIAREHPGEPVKAYTFLYGQKHAVELDAARAVAAVFGMEHHVVELPAVHGSALTDADLALPQGRDLAAAVGVAPSYVPARNLLFLAHLATLQDAAGPGVLWLGVHHDDHTGYPDCRPEFVDAADEAIRQGTQYGLRVRAPFVLWDKVDIIRWGLAQGVPYELTHSCYQGRRPACGVCDTCQGRLQAFAAAGVSDPLPYERLGGVTGR